MSCPEVEVQDELPDLERACDWSGRGRSSDGRPRSCRPSASSCSGSESYEKIDSKVTEDFLKTKTHFGTMLQFNKTVRVLENDEMLLIMTCHIH